MTSKCQNKFPWKPNKYDIYYTFTTKCATDYTRKWAVMSTYWVNYPSDFANFSAGWVYRTEEAAKEALPIIAKELGVEYSV